MFCLLTEETNKINAAISRNFPGRSNAGLRNEIRNSLQTGNCERLCRRIALTESGVLGLQQVDAVAREVSVLASVDPENSAEEFWQNSPNTRALFGENLIVRLSRTILARITDVPGWSGGPVHAPHPLVITE
jgi:hypothetical protein